jgi:hypothetical protein
MKLYITLAIGQHGPLGSGSSGILVQLLCPKRESGKNSCVWSSALALSNRPLPTSLLRGHLVPLSSRTHIRCLPNPLTSPDGDQLPPPAVFRARRPTQRLGIKRTQLNPKSSAIDLRNIALGSVPQGTSGSHQEASSPLSRDDRNPIVHVPPENRKCAYITVSILERRADEYVHRQYLTSRAFEHSPS